MTNMTYTKFANLEIVQYRILFIVKFKKGKIQTVVLTNYLFY